MDANLKEANVVPHVLSALVKIVTLHRGILGKTSVVTTCTGAIVDKVRGIVATDQAYVAQGNEWRIWLSTTNKVVPASLDRRWIHWDANIAFLKIAEEYLPLIDAEYNEIAFGEPSPQEEAQMEQEYIEMRLVGFMNSNESEGPLFKPFQRTCDIVQYRTHFGIYLPALLEETKLRHQTHGIADEDKAKLFRKYIRIYCRDGIIPDMGGFLLTTTDGIVLGILDRGEKETGLAIPSSEINLAFRNIFPK